MLVREPENARLAFLAGLVCRELGRTRDARKYLRFAASNIEDEPHLWTSLGQVEQILGDSEAAESAFTKAASLEPTPESLYGLAAELEKKGLRYKALDIMQRAWQMAPNRPEVAYRIAQLAHNMGDNKASLEWAVRAVRLKPDYWQAYFAMATAMQRLGHYQEAVEAYHSLLLVEPQNPAVNRNLGAMCMRLGLRVEAVRYFRRAAELQAGMVDIECDLVHQQLFVHDWEELETRSAALLERFRASNQSMQPFSTFTIPGSTPSDLKLVAERLVALNHSAAQTGARVAPRELTPADAERKIRLGYLSCDFHEHATAYLMARLFELHDRDRFELFAYDWTSRPPGAIGQRVKANFDVVRRVQGIADEQVAEMIRADEIDVLVDLKGHTQDGRLGILACRPAPVQLHHVGYPGTLGAPFIDYLVADRWVAPPERAGDFTEKLAYLPDCYQPTDATRAIDPRPSRRECGLPEDGIVFCSFNQPYKFTPDVFDLWCQLLRETPGSVLWLMSWVPAAEQNLRNEAGRRGVEAERILFAPLQPQAAHLGRLQNADIFLDTLPVNAHTTASDALWAGVPVVTRSGESFVSRVAGSLLRTHGFTELIASTPEQYVSIARDLALNPEKLRGLKERLLAARTTSPLFDSERYTRHLEALYVQMWRRRVAGLAPAMLDITGEVEPVSGERVSGQR